MADTIRTRAALLTLLADNVTGDISAQDLRDMLVTLFGVYGEILVFGGSTAQTGIGTSFTKMTGFAADGDSVGMTPAHASDQITADNAGVYCVIFSCSFSGSVNATFTFEIQVDGVTKSNGGAERKLSSGGDVGDVSLNAIITLAAAEVVIIAVKADGASKEITPTYASLTMKKLA